MAQLFWPFATSTVSEWPGARPSGWADHVGTDFAVPQGTPLKATMSGTVDIIWNDGLGAWVIDIIAPDGTVARHGHLSHMAVKDGQWVNAGDYIGNTGGAIGTPGAGLSTGSHLHWEIRNNTGWGAWGWYDPRDLTIDSFDTPAGSAQSFASKNTTIGAAPMRRRKKGSKMLFFWCFENERYFVVTPGVKGSFWDFATSSENAGRLGTQLGSAMHVTAKTFETHKAKWG